MRRYETSYHLGDGLLSAAEVIRKTGASMADIDLAIANKELAPPIVVAGRLRWHASEVQHWFGMRWLRKRHTFVG